MRVLKTGTITAMLCLVCACAARARNENSLTWRFQGYDDNNHAAVMSHLVRLVKQVTPFLSVDAGYTTDAVTAASHRHVHGSRERVSEEPENALKWVDGTTGATRELRREIDGAVGLTFDIPRRLGAPNPGQNPTRLKLGGIYGTENDYEARAASITVEQDLFQRNTTIGARYLTNDDRIVTDTPFAAPIHAEGEEPAGRKKRTHTINFLVTHGITPRTLGSAVVQYRIDRGYLAHPYHAVRIGDLFYPERYPRTRSAVVGKGTLKQYVKVLQGMVLDASYRHYRDTWSMRSHTVDAAVFLRPWKRVGFGPLYRYYRQTSAFFYQDRYASPRRYLSADFRYRRCTTHGLGMKLFYDVRDFLPPDDLPLFSLFPVGADIQFHVYRRSGPRDEQVLRDRYAYWPAGDGFRAFWVQTGVRFAF